MSEDGRSVERARETVAVVGLGLMGGSLCRSLKALPSPPRVLGSDPAPLEGTYALEAGVVDRFDLEPEAILPEADVVVYAAPMGPTLSLIREHADAWRDDALVTDVVSLKAPILRAAAAAGRGRQFIGAHPICGGEESGFRASRAELYRGVPIWLCAHDSADSGARQRADAFWRQVGGVPKWIRAEEHDERMAWVSHLPQLLANALAGALDAAGYRPDDLGPGGRDMTRLASSNPGMWKDLLEVSAPVTGTGLTSVANALNVLGDLLARREVERISEFMERTKAWREGGSGDHHGTG